MPSAGNEPRKYDSAQVILMSKECSHVESERNGSFDVVDIPCGRGLASAITTTVLRYIHVCDSAT